MKKRPSRYHRVTCHQKNLLRKLVFSDKKTIKEASQILKMNYSTAKSIMFNDRKKNEHINEPFTKLIQQTERNCNYAIICSVGYTYQIKKIQIISTIGQINFGTNKQSGETMQQN